MENIYTQQREVYDLQINLDAEQYMWSLAMSTTNRVVDMQIELVHYMIFQVLGRKKNNVAVSTFKHLIDNVPNGSDKEKIAYWNDQIKLGLDACEQKWARYA